MRHFSDGKKWLNHSQKQLLHNNIKRFALSPAIRTFTSNVIFHLSILTLRIDWCTLCGRWIHLRGKKSIYSKHTLWYGTDGSNKFAKFEKLIRPLGAFAVYAHAILIIDITIHNVGSNLFFDSSPLFCHIYKRLSLLRNATES